MSIQPVPLYLHVADDNYIWFAIADGPPINSEKTLINFLLNSFVSDFSHWRLIGTAKNAHLILSLYSKLMQTGTGCIELCSPIICKTNEDRHTAERVLYAIRRFNRTPSMGGWHIFNNDDYVVYALISYMQKVSQVDDHARRLLKAHPIWPALTFIPHLNIEACCNLIATIIDPRWFVDMCHPNRGSKLTSYLGLNIRSAINKKASIYSQRCNLVHSVWNGQKDFSQINEPSYFLLRIFKDVSKKKNSIIASLRTSQKFIDFLRLTWLAALNRKKQQAEALFVPNYFFKTTEEVQAFGTHLEMQLSGEK